ncbi:MAG: [FeFe] hydrogenase H-cluster radical SAM maturase HydE [Candidatus Omnitrophica bacterium]|nr:[FeFe] hydrogenase H-cluster radical SAM maturase HydE [Candidatus Omnitrophota bacterium]
MPRLTRSGGCSRRSILNSSNIMSGSKTANGIFISEGLIRFRALCRWLGENPATLQLAEVRGKRWSFLDGDLPPDADRFDLCRIRISDSFGLLIYGGARLPADTIRNIRAVALRLYAFERYHSQDQLAAALAGKDDAALFTSADTVREVFCGREVHLRAIIEFSNICRRDCMYCGIRRQHRGVTRYRMNPEEIYRAARAAAELGYRTVVLQSGDECGYPLGELCTLIRRIKKDFSCAVTLSSGEKTFSEYRQLRESGTDRYLLKFETSDRALYRMLKPDSSYAQRFRCIRWLKQLHYQTGSGLLTGVPGQTDRILARDVCCLRSLDLDMVGIGPFIPHPGTPLGKEDPGDSLRALRAVALTRILCPDTHLPATTALATRDAPAREQALRCGANVIMPDLTPARYRQHYQIYPGKPQKGAPLGVRKSLEALIRAAGRTVGKDRGESIRMRRERGNG